MSPERSGGRGWQLFLSDMIVFCRRIGAYREGFDREGPGIEAHHRRGHGPLPRRSVHRCLLRLDQRALERRAGRWSAPRLPAPRYARWRRLCCSRRQQARRSSRAGHRAEHTRRPAGQQLVDRQRRAIGAAAGAGYRRAGMAGCSVALNLPSPVSWAWVACPSPSSHGPAHHSLQRGADLPLPAAGRFHCPSLCGALAAGDRAR